MSTETAPSGVIRPALRRHALNGPAMGSRWSATFWAAEDFDTGALTCALQAAVDRVEQQMSTWRPDSDLERLNAAPVGQWVPVPKELMGVLDTALEIGRLSAGAFDIGVGDLVRAWGFGGGARTPDAGQIARLEGCPLVDPPKTLQLDRVNGRARRLAPQRLDLSGIAKGFGVDELARVVREAGLGSWLVGIDGEMRAAGAKPDGRPWTIAHEKPDAEAREILGILELSGAAVATSGGYRHRHQLNGRTVSHTMDPRRAEPLESELAAVTVLAESCMAADAWATALLVRGSEEGPALARQLGLFALFVENNGRLTTTAPKAAA